MKKFLLLLFLLCFNKKIFAYSENDYNISFKFKYRANNILKNEDDVSFELYQNDLLVGEYKTEKDYIDLYLKDGNYRLVLKNDLKGYCYDNDYFFKINDTNKIFNIFRKSINFILDILKSL